MASVETQETAVLVVSEPRIVDEPQIKSADLLPYVAQGVCDGLQPPDAGNESVETLLVRPLPWWKRAIDVFGASVGLILASPLMILSALAIKVTSRGPIIFKQRRAGLGGQPFWIYKFRTMTVDAESRKASLREISEQDGPAFKLSHDPRVTRVGRFLRETSLDELPQLWNVLKGDMSLVGPRPLPMDESAGCDQWQRTRLDVTPGLTCIWQVKGRSRVTFDEWMRMDVNYIRRRNFLHDFKILTQTIPAVLLRRGAR
jgi:lipopolysaccharide/colanic/teichoic acid biosynthesis glycosyltransferase